MNQHKENKTKASTERYSRTCSECRGPAAGKRENYAYTECGLKNVVLEDVLVYRCKNCGAETVIIPNMDGLHRTLALAVLCKRRLLSGNEIRFLREVAGLTATGLAKTLGVTKTAVSRWENRGKIGLASDRAVRATCGIEIIAGIVTQNSGAVNPSDVDRTFKTLQRFFTQFSPKAVNVENETGESEKLLIDPSLPFSFSLLPKAAIAPRADSLIVN